MAIAIVLLVSAGLTLRSFQRLVAVNPGFEVEHGLTFRLALPESGYAADRDVAALFLRLLDRLETLPGVESAAAGTELPLGVSGRESGHRIEDEVRRGEADLPTVFAMRQISPDYFSTVGIPLLAGRSLELADVEQRTGAVVVSQSLAERHWPGESALGKRIFPGTPDEDEDWYEVVGVVGDVRLYDLVQPPKPTVYYSMVGQQPDALVARNQTLLLRLAAGVVGEGLVLALVGGGAGLLAAAWLTRFLESLLFEVGTREPLVFAGVTLLLVVVVVAACLLPARRAAGVDPAVALRND